MGTFSPSVQIFGLLVAICDRPTKVILYYKMTLVGRSHYWAGCYARKHKDGALLPDNNGKGGSNQGPHRQNKHKMRRMRKDTDSDEEHASAHFARRNPQRSDSEGDSDDGHDDGQAYMARSYAAIM